MLILNFPVGFYQFHNDPAINFQMNRWYSTGAVSYDELMQVGKRIDSFETWTKVFLNLAEETEAKGELEQCAIYYRAAQFFTLGDLRDEQGELLKTVLYEKCRNAYEKAYQEEGIIYEKVPFQTGYLPVMYKRHSQSSKGAIVIHGGYDSFIQEFVRYMLYLYEAGYDVYMFEGYGQGEVLYRCNMKMRPDWETCTRPILDYYQLEDVTLIGISLGGYLASKVASVEDMRVKRLVMYDLIYDFYGALMGKMGPKAAKLMNYLTGHPKNIMWKAVTRKMNHNFFCKWLFEQGYFIYQDVHNPYEYFNCIKQYNTRELSSKITQDVLVMAGASDIYTIFLEEQKRALVNAKSVTVHLYTEKDHADHHCQIGNLKLALDDIIKWVEKYSES